MINRRTFLAGTGAVLLAAPFAAEAQQAGKIYRIGVMFVGSVGPHAYLDAFRQGLRELGWIEGKNIELEELDEAFPAMVRARSEALLVVPTPLFIVHRTRLAELATKARLPTLFGAKEYVEAGGLMSYGASVLYNYRHVAVYVDKILKGAKPADLPIEQPTKFELVITSRRPRPSG